MKKSLIALAVAGVVSAPAFAATSNVDVYGSLHIAIEDTSGKNVTPGVVDNASRLGFKGSEDLGGGLKAVWQIESTLGATGNKATGVGGGTLAGRNTFIGLAGGFGTALIGRHDTPYKLATTKYNIFADTIADYAGGRLDGVKFTTGHHRDNSAIAYISPNMGGLTVAAALVANDNAGANDKTLDALSVALMYANGPLSASLSFQDAGDHAGINGKDEAWKLGLGYAFGDTSVGFMYEDVSANGSGTLNTADRDSWFVSVAHAMGPITLKGQYGQVDVGNKDQDGWALGADYNLSKRTAAFVVYASGDGDNTPSTDVKGWNIGMRHSF